MGDMVISRDRGNSSAANMTAGQLAAALGVSERTVRNRAASEGWPKPTPAGWILAGLPAHIRQAIACATTDQAAGFDAGCAWKATADQAAEAARGRAESRLAAFAALTEPKRAVADARLAILKARDAFVLAAGLPLKRGTIAFCAEFAAGSIRLPDADLAVCRDGKSLSWDTINRWQKAYDAHGPAGLAPGYAAGRQAQLPEAMGQFIEAMVCRHPHKGPAGIRKMMGARFSGMAIPSRATVARYRDAWIATHQAAYTMLTAPDRYRSTMRPAVGRADEDICRLNQRWEFDGTPADVMCTDGRFTLIGVIDVYSRRAKLHVSPTAKAAAVAALTRRALLDWGVPEIARTDNGSDYVSRHLRRVFEDLAIYQDIVPPFSPEKKPFIERFFRTWSHGLLELCPGFVGHSVADRQAIRERESFAKRLMTRGETVGVPMTSAKLQEFCDDWCQAVYHQDPHQGLDGMTPAQTARAWTGPVARITDERALDILLAPAPEDGGLRTIAKHGISVGGGWYHGPEMAGHEGKQVFVLLDPTDFGGVYVFWPTDPRQFVCRAIDPDREGIDRQQFAERVKTAAKELLEPQVKELRRIVKEQAVDTIHAEYMAHRKGQIAEVIDLPRPALEHTTAALSAAADAAEDRVRQAAGPVPGQITSAQEKRAQEVIDLAAARSKKALPATEYEVYEFLQDEAGAGRGLTENETRWMGDYEYYQETGKRRGLLAAGFRPMAERQAEGQRPKAEVK